MDRVKDVTVTKTYSLKLSTLDEIEFIVERCKLSQSAVIRTAVHKYYHDLIMGRLPREADDEG